MELILCRARSEICNDRIRSTVEAVFTLQPIIKTSIHLKLLKMLNISAIVISGEFSLLTNIALVLAVK